MVALLLGWFVLEGSATLIKWKNLQTGSYNTPTVSWNTKFISKRSKFGGQLARVLALCMWVGHTSPLVSHQIAGKRNILRDVPPM